MSSSTNDVALEERLRTLTVDASIWFASDGPGAYRFTLTAVNGESVQETFVVGGGA